MKVTAFLKKTDLVVQISLFALLFAGLAIQLDQTTFYYFLLAGWQVFSMVVHGICSGNFYHSVYRERFYRLLMYMLIALVVVAAVIPLLVFLLPLLVAPFLAAYYLFVCADELLILRRKAWVHLK